jgi:putative ABC transport system ATP-binding protein
MPHIAPSANATHPALELIELEVGLGPRQLRLDRRCVLQAGRLYLVLGPSGSGKSSFARALLGFGELSDPVTPCQGEVLITDIAGNDHLLWKASVYNPAARRHIAFLPQAEKLGFIDALSVTDNLALFSHLAPTSAHAEIERLAGQFRLSPMPLRLASASGGERIRMSAVRGLLPREAGGGMPEVIIADEPTSALDRVSAKAMARSLIDLARSGRCVVMVITHEPERFVDAIGSTDSLDEQSVRIVECQVGDNAISDGRGVTVARLRLEAVPQSTKRSRDFISRALESMGELGAFALSPLAFIWGLLGPHRPLFLLRQTLVDSVGLGTHAFSLVGCLLIAGTAAYFIFERLPKPELLDPLLLPEMMIVTGHTLVRVVLPLGACGLITTKLGAAQAARLFEVACSRRWRWRAGASKPMLLSPP